MLLLTSASDILRVVAGTASCVEPHASWIDNVSGTITPGRTNTATLGATTTTVIAAPGTGQRNVKWLSLRNTHASSSCDVEVQHYDGTNSESLVKVTLLPGETLVYDETGHWWHYDVNGGAYSAGSGLATRGQSESGRLTDIAVTPGIQHYHLGHPKCWCKNGVTGNILASYNITSVTDTGTGLCAPQIGTGFTDAQWCCMVTVERASTLLTVANLLYGFVRNLLQLTAAVTLECYNGTATTAVQTDPTSWHMVGLGTLV